MAQDLNLKRTGAFFDAGGACYNVRNPLFGAIGDGIADDRPAFVLCDATPGPCIVPNIVDDDPALDHPGIYLIGTDLTLANSWNIVPGAMLRPANGVTVTINGKFRKKDASQCFDLSLGGNVVFGPDAVDTVQPGWWGLPIVGSFTDGDATPSVARGHLFQTANTAATIITNFDDGFEGQRILIKLDALATVQHNANIILAIGTSLSDAANKVLVLVRMGGVWIQEGFASSIPTGGGGGGQSGTAYWQTWELLAAGSHAPDIARFTSYNDPNENYEMRVRADGAATGGKILKNEGSGGASRSWVFTQVPATPTADILIRIRSLAAHGANAGMGIMCRMSVNADNTVNGWGVRLHGAVGTAARRFGGWKYVADTVVIQGGDIDASANWTDGTWMYIRLHVDSLSVKSRYWAEGEVEPTVWQQEYNHDVNLTTGWVGVYADQPSVAQEEIDWISVETNGGLAQAPGTAYAVTIPTPVITTPAHGPFDFEAEMLGNQPSGWTERGNTTNVNWLAADDAGNTVINSVKTAGGASYLDLDAMSDAATTQEILAKLRQSTLAANGSGLALRVNNDGRAYCLELDTAGLAIVEFGAGTPPAFVGALISTTFQMVAAEWYWARFRADGTSLMFRVWAIDEPEPKQWYRVATDASIASGSAGLYHFPNNTTEYDDVSIAVS